MGAGHAERLGVRRVSRLGAQRVNRLGARCTNRLGARCANRLDARRANRLGARCTERRGLTLIELVLALGLASLLVLALVKLIDTSMTLWRKTEERRSQNEMSSAVTELLASDLAAVEGGPRGDLLVEWAPFDVDGDGIATLPCLRLRLVRAASAGEIAQLQVASDAPMLGQGLLEVCWALLPASTSGARLEWDGVLWRGVRLHGPGPGISLLDPRFFASSGRPAPGVLEEVTGGVLWFEALCASAGTDLSNGWESGAARAQALASWDARGAARPDAERFEANEPGAEMSALLSPLGTQRAQLPRRVRLVFEVETARGKLRRVSTTADVGLKEGALRVDDASKLPPDGSFLLLGEEWLELLGTSGNEARVRRGQRGTRAAEHKAGAWLRHGERSQREVVIPAQREEWRP
jgi:hypothetical protein